MIDTKQNLIYLKNSIIIKNIIKKPKLKFFKEINIGDILDLSTPVLYNSHLGLFGTVFSKNVLVVNKRTGSKICESQSEISTLLYNNFIYEEFIENENR